MPKVARFQMADGRVARYEVPEDATPEQAQAMIQGLQPQAAGNPIQPGAQNFAEEMSFPQQMLAGVGKAFHDIGRGIQQLPGPRTTIKGIDELRQMVSEDRRLDAPLMATPGGRTGELGGNLASVLPTLAIPGLNTIRGAAMLGGAFGLAQPSASTLETAANTGIGTLLGGTGQALANKLVSATAPVVKSVRDSILSKAQDLGFVVSPAEGKAGIVNKLMTGLGNKQQTAQEAAIRNAGTVEKIAKADLGLPETESLTPETFQTVRSEAYQQGYKPVENLNIVRSDSQFEKQVASLAAKESQGRVTRSGQGDIESLVKEVKGWQGTGKQLVDDIRTLREEGNSNIKSLKDIGQQQLGRAQLEASNALESLAERNLALNKAPADTIANFRNARATIAKAHTIEDAMQGTSEINPAKFARNEMDAKKLSPDMYAAWKFAKEFPKSNQLAAKVGGVPWNVLLPSSILGGVGYGASGHKEGALLGLAPLLRGPARSIALSRLYQSMMVNPGTIARGASPMLPAAKAAQRIAPQTAALLTSELE